MYLKSINIAKLINVIALYLMNQEHKNNKQKSSKISLNIQFVPFNKTSHFLQVSVLLHLMLRSKVLSDETDVISPVT